MGQLEEALKLVGKVSDTEFRHIFEIIIKKTMTSYVNGTDEFKDVEELIVKLDSNLKTANDFVDYLFTILALLQLKENIEADGDIMKRNLQ